MCCWWIRCSSEGASSSRRRSCDSRCGRTDSVRGGTCRRARRARLRRGSVQRRADAAQDGVMTSLRGPAVPAALRVSAVPSRGGVAEAGWRRRSPWSFSSRASKRPLRHQRVWPLRLAPLRSGLVWPLRHHGGYGGGGRAAGPGMHSQHALHSVAEDVPQAPGRNGSTLLVLAASDAPQYWVVYIVSCSCCAW